MSASILPITNRLATVLLVDDDGTRRRLLRAKLEALPLAVIECGSLSRSSDILRAGELDLVYLANPGLAVQLHDSLLAARGPRLVLAGVSGELPRGVRDLRFDLILSRSAASSPIDPSVRHLAELGRAERTLRLREVALSAALEARDGLTQLVIHDLRGPLSVLQMNLEFAMRSLADAIVMPELIQDALTATRRLVAMTTKLLQMGRLEAGTGSPRRADMPLRALVEDSLVARRGEFSRREVRIELDLDGEVRAEADAGLLRLVVDNILDNAMRYAPQGGRVRMWAEERGDGAVLLIGNSGPPVPQHARTAIFQKFGRTSEGGHVAFGLGLYFCRLAIEAHGGRLWCEEHATLPSVFAISLPLLLAKTEGVSRAAVA